MKIIFTVDTRSDDLQTQAVLRSVRLTLERVGTVQVQGMPVAEPEGDTVG